MITEPLLAIDHPDIRDGPVREVFLEPLWKLRGEQEYLLRYPPEGYRFVTRATAGEALAGRLSRASAAYRALWWAWRFAPLQLLKPYWERFKRIPDGSQLTYAVLHPVFRNEPWVMDMCGEQPHLLVGDEAMFARLRPLLRRTLASAHCRKVLYHVEIGKKALLASLQAPELAEKVEVVYPAVPARAVCRPERSGPVRLLFLGSANIDAGWQFRDKGGLVLLEAFRYLRERYPDLELVVRSRLPSAVRKRWAGVPGVRLIERTLLADQLEREFLQADIFVCPAHLTPSVTFLDAMSYGLPIVTTDVWSNPELVEHGRTGLLVHHPDSHRYIQGYVAHHDWPAFKDAVRSVSPALVRDFAAAVATLIEDAELRRRLGEQGRREVEEGRFSLATRNQRLKAVLDEALELGPA